MNRRNFLYGLGAATVGGTTLIGSGAYTAGTVEGREADIDVVNDSDGVMSLLSMQPGSDVIFEGEEDGRLGIDFTAGGADGVNVGGQFQLGYKLGDGPLARRHPDASGWGDTTLEDTYPGLSSDAPGLTWFNSAFAVWNRATQTYDLEIAYEADEPGDSEITFHVFNGAEYDYGSFTVDGGDNPNSLTIEADEEPDGREFRPNKRVFVSIEIDTLDGHPDDDLTGELTLTADNPQ